MQPNTRLNKYDCDKNHTPDFHRLYRGIVGSLRYLVTMTDLAWAYSELSKYVQFPGKNYMLDTEHVLIRDKISFVSVAHLTRGDRSCSWALYRL